MGGCFHLFYYQYSTSGGGVQGDSLIFRSGRLNFEQSAPASALIPDKGIPTLDNPILDSPAVRHQGRVIPRVAYKAVAGLNIPPQAGTFATSSEKYGFLTMKNFPNKWGIYDAFPGCYSLSGTYSIKSPGWQFRYSHKLLIVRVSIIP